MCSSKLRTKSEIVVGAYNNNNNNNNNNSNHLVVRPLPTQECPSRRIVVD
jgi:hypothetical protein